MLACRIPYFATLLSSDFTDKSSNLSLGVCSSDIFNKILDFVWEGELLLQDMPIIKLFNLLEAARFLCIDLLVDGVSEYIEHQFQSKKFDFVSSLNALDFSVSHEFPRLTTIILGHLDLDQHIEEVSFLPEFKTLSSASVMAILTTIEKRVSSEILVFKAFLRWLESNNDVSEATREEMMKSFDLNNFSDDDLETVKKSALFDDEKLFQQVHSRLLERGATIATKNLVIESLKPTTTIATKNLVIESLK